MNGLRNNFEMIFKTHRGFDCFESSELGLGWLKGYVRYWLAVG